MSDESSRAVRHGNVRTGGASLVILAYLVIEISPIHSGPLIGEPRFVQAYSLVYFVLVMLTLVLTGTTMMVRPEAALRGVEAAREAYGRLSSPLPIRALLAGVVALIVMMEPLDTDVNSEAASEVSTSAE